MQATRSEAGIRKVDEIDDGHANEDTNKYHRGSLGFGLSLGCVSGQADGQQWRLHLHFIVLSLNRPCRLARSEMYVIPFAASVAYICGSCGKRKETPMFSLNMFQIPLLLPFDQSISHAQSSEIPLADPAADPRLMETSYRERPKRRRVLRMLRKILLSPSTRLAGPESRAYPTYLLERYLLGADQVDNLNTVAK
jgi:hypothetical protein